MYKQEISERPFTFKRYEEIILNYLNDGIIELIPENEEGNNMGFFLPHREVIRNDRSTTKLRIVFVVSSHAKPPLSLNDCLETGPNLTNDIFDILIKFRNNAIAMQADIQQAFLNVGIDEKDRNYTKFLWTDEPSESGNIFIFRFNRVLFGLTCSPSLLAATIKHHLSKFILDYPDTSKMLKESLYVDDIISPEDIIDKAFTFSKEALEMFDKANMKLRKWKTNSKELKHLWASHGIETELSSDNFASSEQKVLGIRWNSDEDNFYFNTEELLEFIRKDISTKIFILQAAGRIFDPMEYLSPFIIRIKGLIQKVWCAGLEWVEELSEDLRCE